jgi:hypothetical protein
MYYARIDESMMMEVKAAIPKAANNGIIDPLNDFPPPR